MLTNEATHLKPPANVWEWLDRDMSSPLHRLYRLQSMLKTLYLALDSEHATDEEGVSHLEAFAKFVFEESEGIGGDLEDWLAQNPYFSPAKTS